MPDDSTRLRNVASEVEATCVGEFVYRAVSAVIRFSAWAYNAEIVCSLGLAVALSGVRLLRASYQRGLGGNT